MRSEVFIEYFFSYFLFAYQCATLDTLIILAPSRTCSQPVLKTTKNEIAVAQTSRNARKDRNLLKCWTKKQGRYNVENPDLESKRKITFKQKNFS